MSWASRFYESRIFPWLNDRFLGDPRFEQLRGEALAAARGEVVEIGFGSGKNLPHYPAAVTRLVAIEPNDGMIGRAVPRIARSRFPVEVLSTTAEKLPLADASFDTAVSVLTLCSVADPARAAAELRRVLRDDGRLLVVEHGLADDPAVARWQRRLDRLETIVACGCHLDRPTVETIEAQRFRFESVRHFFAPGVPRTHGWLTVGVARKA